MSKFKKVLSLILVVAVTAGIAITGTMAYLTSEDSDVNVMTLGGVEIEQIEQEWNDDKTELVDFTQGKPLYPYTDSLGWENKEENDGAYRRFTMNNVVDKYVSVENTGKSDAYVRTVFAFEMGDYTSVEEFRNKVVGFSRNVLNGDEFKFPGAWVWDTPFVTTINGETYMIWEAVHQDAIAPEETTIPSLLQVYLNKDATNETVEKLDGNNNGTYDILALSQAIQAAGFSDAQTALDTGFGDVNVANVQTWFGDMSNVQYVEADGATYQMEGEEAAAVLALLQNGTDLILDEDMDIIAFDTTEVDAQGATVTMQGVGPEAYGYLAFIPDAGENVIVSNLNVTGSGFVEVGHYNQGGGNYTLTNVKIENLASTLANTDKGFTLGCAFLGFGTTTLNNCVMTGTTAIQDGVLPVDLGCGQNLTTVVNGGEYGTIYCWSHSTVTISGAEVDTIYAAPIKGTVTIEAGTHVDTLNIDYGTAAQYATDANLAKIDIENGATVDTIVYDGNTYTLTEWLAR